MFFRCHWDGLWLSCPANPWEHGLHEGGLLLFHPIGPSLVVEDPTPLCWDSSFSSLLRNPAGGLAPATSHQCWLWVIVLMSSVGLLHPLLHRSHVSRVSERPNMFKTHYPSWMCNPFSTEFMPCKAGYLIQIWHQARENIDYKRTHKVHVYPPVLVLCGSWNQSPSDPERHL